jgi:beta-glucanase (GH16 family)
MFGIKSVSFGPSTSKAAIEGTYGEDAQGQPKPYRGTTFNISDGGFMGWLVGSSTYDIISVSDDELIVRIIQAGDGFAWYHKFTSTKPTQDAGYVYNDLVWEDDFNTDGAPDATNWDYDLGAGGWGNGEVQTYTNSAENAKVLDGSLIITAKVDGSGGYTSARLKSQGLRKFKYGRVEVRAKLPASAGTWPAIWMLGSNYTTVGWPTCGEIDIMEQRGANKDITLGTVHWYNTTANSNASYGETTAVADASSDFHLYTVEWSDTSIKIYLDDVSFFQMDNDSTLPFNADFFMILNIAMGGTLGGDIDPGFTEDTMEIDYVKVFQ